MKKEPQQMNFASNVGKTYIKLWPDELRAKLKAWLLDKKDLKYMEQHDTKQITMDFVAAKDGLDCSYVHSEKYDIYKSCRGMIVNFELTCIEIAAMLKRHCEAMTKPSILEIGICKAITGGRPMDAVRELYRQYADNTHVVAETFNSQLSLKVLYLYNL